MKLDEYFNKLWDKYSEVNPEVKKIKKLLEKEKFIENDHIALRTIKKKGITKEDLSKIFIEYGYEVKKSYFFKQKGLEAIHLEKKGFPRVFISEKIMDEQFSNFKKYFNLEKIDQSVLYGERPWDANFELYKKMNKESEYLSWVYAFGIIPNHFTVNVNNSSFNSLEEIIKLLKNEGYKINNSGGEIKHSENLDQASTMANKSNVSFEEGVFEIPSCYYEFALRRNNFNGFVSDNADKIFESTNKANDVKIKKEN